MRKYQDNFNLVSGVTKTVTEYLTIGKHTLLRVQMHRDGKLSRTEWMHKIDTMDAPYPSLACICGAASWSFFDRRALPIIYRFFRAIIK